MDEDLKTHIRDGCEGLRDLSMHLSGRVSRCSFACFSMETTGETSKSAEAKLQAEYVIEIAKLILERITEIEAPTK